jgi:hypothetical protein
MTEVPPRVPRTPVDYRELPEPIALKDTITSRETDPAPDPTMGRDTETEFLVRNAGAV